MKQNPIFFRGLFLAFIVLGINVYTLKAQVLVHQEPLHRPVFSNGQIRILDVVMPPGDSSVFHIHHTPSLFIVFTNSRTGSMMLDQLPEQGSTVAGTMLYENLSAPHTRTHRVWNMDKDTFHVMDIELLSDQAEFRQPPLTQKGLQLDIDTAYVRSYYLRLEKGQSFSLKEDKRDLLLISFDKALVNTGKGKQPIASGSFWEISKGKSFSISNEGGASALFAVIEWAGK